MSSPKISPLYRARMRNAMRWYAPSRIGIFYHFGLFTGGGCASTDERFKAPLKYKTPAEFEAAAKSPAAIARRLAKNALDMGARYTILTAWHTCGGSMPLFPTRQPEFLHKTRKDYIGPYLREVRKAGLHPMIYMPGDCHNWDADEVGPTLDESVVADGCEAYAELTRRVLDEMRERYGDLIEGFWIDGAAPGAFSKIPAYMKKLWPKCIVVVNNRDIFDIDEMDFGTTECHEDAPVPPYNRPSAYVRRNAWGCILPPNDFNEDIPTPNDWWFQGEDHYGKDYDDPFFLTRQMICSLGQRGVWNFAPGIGPRIDGSIQPKLVPSVKAMRKFLSWAGEAIYNTKGAAGTFFNPGHFHGHTCVGFYSVTNSLSNPNVFYALVTWQRSGRMNHAIFATNGRAPKRITDLRTGNEHHVQDAARRNA